MKIIVDLLGSDKGPETIFKGVIETSKLHKDLSFVVIGPQEILKKIENTSYSCDVGNEKVIKIKRKILL